MSSLRNDCSEGLEELKEKICIEDMMLDEDIFLTFDKKFKDIINEKDKIIKNLEEYQQFKEQLKILSESIQQIYNEIYSFLDKYLTNDIYTKIQKETEKLDLLPINKKDTFYQILSDIKKKSPKKNQENNNINLTNNINIIEAKYVCQPIENTNIIIIYDVINKKPIIKNFLNNLFISQFPTNCAWINYKNNLYISGGNYNGTNFENLIKYDPEKNQISILGKIPENKEHHSMCCDDNDNIYIIGGTNNSILKYNIVEQKWIKFNNELNIQRNHPICVIKDDELYIFFGMGLFFNYINSFEKTNINGKEEIKLCNINTKINLEYASTLETIGNCILFFGGKNEKGATKTCLKFNVEKQNFEECNYSLQAPSYFHQNYLNQIEENCYGYFSLENNNFVKINFNYND